MKALSLHPHWADRIRSGTKTIEIRTWPTKHRGPLLICATKRPNPSNLPAGVAICTVDLVDCRPMRKEDEPAAGVKFHPSYYAWILRHPRPVPPTPIKGKQRLFTAHCDFVWVNDGTRREQRRDDHRIVV